MSSSSPVGACAALSLSLSLRFISEYFSTHTFHCEQSHSILISEIRKAAVSITSVLSVRIDSMHASPCTQLLSVSPTHDIFLECLASVCGCVVCCIAFDAVILMNINANRNDKVPVSIYRMVAVLWMNVCHTFCHPKPIAKLSVSIPNKKQRRRMKNEQTQIYV